MRTTLDLPDPLMRELKARAALEGVKRKDYLARIVQSALQRPLAAAAGAAPKRSPVPVFRRAKAKPMPAMSNVQLYAALDAQDAARVKR